MERPTTPKPQPPKKPIQETETRKLTDEEIYKIFNAIKNSK